MYVLVKVSGGKSILGGAEEAYSPKTVAGYVLPGRVTFLIYKSSCQVQQNTKEKFSPYDCCKNVVIWVKAKQNNFLWFYRYQILPNLYQNALSKLGSSVAER